MDGGCRDLNVGVGQPSATGFELGVNRALDSRDTGVVRKDTDGDQHALSDVSEVALAVG